MSFSLTQIDDLIDALLDNAADLLSDARLLYKNQRFARAFALSHMAREEIARNIMLQAAGYRVLTGSDVDWKKLTRRLRSHEEKLKLDGIENAVHASAFGQRQESANLLKLTVANAKYRNKRKNVSLYVEVDQGRISRPSNEFSDRQAYRTLKLGELFLEEQREVRNKLGRYDKRDPAKYKGTKVPDPAAFDSEGMIDSLAELGRARSLIWQYIGKEGSADEDRS